MLVQGGIEKTFSFLHQAHWISALMSITHIHTVWDCFRIQIFCKYFVNNFDDEGATPVTVLSAVPFYFFVPGNKGKHSGVAKLGHS